MSRRRSPAIKRDSEGAPLAARLFARHRLDGRAWACLATIAQGYRICSAVAPWGPLRQHADG